MRVGEIEHFRADMLHGNHIRCPVVCRRHIRQCPLGDLAWLNANEPEKALSELFADGLVLRNTHIFNNQMTGRRDDLETKHNSIRCAFCYLTRKAQVGARSQQLLDSLLLAGCFPLMTPLIFGLCMNADIRYTPRHICFGTLAQAELKDSAMQLK